MSSLSSVGGKYANHGKEFDEPDYDEVHARYFWIIMSLVYLPLVLAAFALPFVVPG